MSAILKEFDNTDFKFDSEEELCDAVSTFVENKLLLPIFDALDIRLKKYTTDDIILNSDDLCDTIFDAEDILISKYFDKKT